MNEYVMPLILAVIGSGFLSTILNYVFKLLDDSRDKKDGIQEATRLIMKDRLRFLCAHYIQQGWIYEDELEDLTVMHKCYHDDLKGNGYLDKLMDKVNNLEIRGIGVK